MSVSAIGASTTWQVGETRPQRPDPSKVLEPAAKALGMTTDDLRAQLASGKTLDDLAQQDGVSNADLINAIKQGLQAAARQGAPALSETQLTQMATGIAAGKQHRHHHGGPPPADATSATDGSSSRAQVNLDTLAGKLGVDPSQLLQALISSSTSATASTSAGASGSGVPGGDADGDGDGGAGRSTWSSAAGANGLGNRWQSDLTQLDGGVAVDEYA
jgi:hypothetical protein